MMSTVPRLSVFRGHEGPYQGIATLDWTLTELYERYLLPVCRLAATDPRAPGTIDKDRHALLWWVRVTGNPPLREVTQPMLDHFAEELAAAEARGGKLLAVNTRRAITIHLQWMLDRVGPKSRRRPRALGLWAEVPWIEAPAAQEARVKDIWRLEELAALLDATGAMARPEWWQSLLLFLYNTGLRIGSAMQATWENVDRNDPGWLYLPAATMKGGKRSHEIPLNDSAREAIELVRRNGEPRLFGRDWPSCKSGMERALGRIKKASGLPPHRCERFAFHAVRGLCYTEGRRINTAGADLLLGHRGVSIGIDCYAGRELMLEVTGKLPQPRWHRQGRLF